MLLYWYATSDTEGEHTNSSSDVLSKGTSPAKRGASLAKKRARLTRVATSSKTNLTAISGNGMFSGLFVAHVLLILVCHLRHGGRTH